MSNNRTDELLQWALPVLHLRWQGFRRNRRQVIRRIAHRYAELGLIDLAAYRAYLETHPDEWRVLDGLCRVTISRFARDYAMWDALVPLLHGPIRVWSAGCGAGEEPYTVAIAWPEADVLATDIDDHQLRRAEAARYPIETLRELPAAWRAAFDRVGNEAQLRDRSRVRFMHHDIRTVPPDGPFDLVLCRNLAFSYFDEATQRDVAQALRGVMRDGAILAVGLHERPPGFASIGPCLFQ